MQTGNKGAFRGLLLIMALAFIACTTQVVGQNVKETSTPVTAAADVDGSWPEVNLNVVVLDKDGVPQKVDENKFQLFEDGAERPFQVHGTPDSPVSLALMIDSSGSVFKYKDTIIAAVKTIVKGLPSGSEVMVADFNGLAYIDLPFTEASKADLSFLDQLHASGPTALYDAVIATESYVALHAKYARRAVVILSDGEENASHMSMGNAYWKMEQAGAPMVYACVPSKANILQRDLMVGHIDMRFLAKNGGGKVFNLSPDAQATAAQIANTIRNQYILQFTAVNTAHDSKARKLDVRLPDKGVQIYALHSYFAPAK